MHALWVDAYHVCGFWSVMGVGGARQRSQPPLWAEQVSPQLRFGSSLPTITTDEKTTRQITLPSHPLHPLTNLHPSSPSARVHDDCPSTPALAACAARVDVVPLVRLRPRRPRSRRQLRRARSRGRVHGIRRETREYIDLVARSQGRRRVD